MARTITLRIPFQSALELGIVFCGKCGHPPNNHFSGGGCAHCACNKYQESFGKYGKEFKPLKRKVLRIQYYLKYMGNSLEVDKPSVTCAHCKDHPKREWKISGYSDKVTFFKSRESALEAKDLLRDVFPKHVKLVKVTTYKRTKCLITAV